MCACYVYVCDGNGNLCDCCVMIWQWSIRKETIRNLARIYRQLMSSSFSSGGSLNIDSQ